MCAVWKLHRARIRAAVGEVPAAVADRLHRVRADPAGLALDVVVARDDVGLDAVDARVLLGRVLDLLLVGVQPGQQSVLHLAAVDADAGGQVSCVQHRVDAARLELLIDRVKLGQGFLATAQVRVRDDADGDLVT